MFGTVINVNETLGLARVIPASTPFVPSGKYPNDLVYTALSNTPLEIGRSYSFESKHGFIDEEAYQLIFSGDINVRRSKGA